MDQLETIKLISNYSIILSEDENSDSLDAKFIICDFSPNANNVSINRSTIENWINSLVTKPVVGKVISLYNGKEDFSGHNAKVVQEVDSEGNKYKTLEFDTQAFGSFYNVGIETIDDVEYITASAKIWKRFKKAYSVFKTRAESKKGLKTSWEINVSESHKETIKNKKVKVIDSGEFIGHCVLGENVTPAYKSSGVLSVASVEDDEFAQALADDLLSLSVLDNDIEEKIIITNEDIISSEGGNELPNEDTTKTSAVTHDDLWTKVRRAINSANADKYYSVGIIYPYDYVAYGYHWDRASQEDFVKFTFTVNSDDTISITAQEDVKMKFVPVSEIDAKVSELQERLDEAEKQIAEAGKLLTDAQKEKEILESQVSELQPYKDKAEELEQAELERELSTRKDDLKSFALEDNLISEEEIESNETISKIFAELTIDSFEVAQEKIEVIKGRRAIAKFKENKEANDEQQTVTSQSNTSKQPKTDLSASGQDEILVTATDLVKSLFVKK